MIEVNFNDAIEMFKEEATSLKRKRTYSYQKRQVNAYREMKVSLTDNDLMIQVDFAETYKKDQQDAIQSAHFGNQCSSIFTACYFIVDGKITNSKQ